MRDSTDFIKLIFWVIPYILWLVVYDNFEWDGWKLKKIPGGRKIRAQRENPFNSIHSTIHR